MAASSPTHFDGRSIALAVALAAILTLAFGFGVARYWLAAGHDGPGQGLYFLFMLLPAALVLSTAAGLTVAGWRRRRGDSPGRAIAAAAGASALVLAALFAFEVWRGSEGGADADAAAQGQPRPALVWSSRAGHLT